MSDIVLHKWDSIIVDWVNCLELSKRIQNINGLRHIDFFNTLIEIYQPDLKSTLNEFLQSHYPVFEIRNDEAHYTEAELRAAASLVLHYTCLYDQRDSLTKPLCEKLSNDVQAYIKNFLEKFTVETTYQEFDGIIRASMESKVPPVDTPTQRGTMEWNSSGESPMLQGSPLHEYFKTPAAAKLARMQEKDREIRRLSRDLEAERFEKEDLTMEIKEHKKRIEQITLEVRDKSQLISRLSSRICEMEENIPDSKPQEVIEMEKLLRSELSDCQAYITQLQGEQEELMNRNDEMTKKMTQAEEAISIWQKKSAEVECKYEELSHQHAAQERELASLKMNYNEISSLLDELRQKDMSVCEMESSMTTLINNDRPSTEDLATTVVEVQLRECRAEMEHLQAELQSQVTHSDIVEQQLQNTLQELKASRKICSELEKYKTCTDKLLQDFKNNDVKMNASINELTTKNNQFERANDDLKKELILSLEKSQVLEDELTDTKLKLNEVNNQHAQLEKSAEAVKVQLEELQSINENLKLTNDDILKQLNDMSSENEKKDSELYTLNLELAERNNTIKTSEEMIASLAKDMDLLRDSHVDLNKQLSDASSRYATLQEESRELQDKYEEAVKNYTQSNFSLDAVQNKLKQTDHEMQTHIDRLEEMIIGAIENSELNKVERFSQLLEKLSTKQMSFENTIQSHQQLNTELEGQVVHLQRVEIKNQEMVQKLQQSLSQAQQSTSEFENLIRDKVCKIDELHGVIDSLNSTITDLDTTEAQLSHTNKELRSTISIWEEKHESMIKVISAKDTELDQLRNCKNDLLSKVSQLKEDCNNKASENKNLAVSLNALEIQSQDFQFHIQKLREEVSEGLQRNDSLLQNLQEVEAFNIDILKENAELKSETQAALDSQISLNDELNLRIQQSLEDLEKKSQLNINLEKKLQTLEELNNTMKEELEYLREQIGYEITKNEDLMRQLQVSDQESTQYIEMNHKLNESIANMQEAQKVLRSELEKCQQEYNAYRDEFNAKLELSYKEQSELKESLSAVRDELEAANKKTTCQKKTINEMLSEMDNQLQKLKDKNSEIASMKEEYGYKDLAKMQIINKLQKDIEELGATNTRLVTDLNVAKDSIDSKRQELQEVQSSLAQLDKQFKKNVVQHEKKIELMNLTIDNQKKQAAKAEEARVQLAKQLEEAFARVSELAQEKEHLASTCTDLRQQKEKFKKELAQAEIECVKKDDVFEQSNKELLALKLEFEVKTAELFETQKTIFTIESEKNEAYKEIDCMRNELFALQERKTASDIELKSVVELKDSMSGKMQQLQDHFETVCKHYHIKMNDLNAATIELVMFKDCREKEIVELNQKLDKLHTELDNTMKDSNSVQEELKKMINEKHEVIVGFEVDIENMRVSEMCLLQEISSLKEELNYTKDKYTEALQIEQEQKAESGEQVRSLTENLSELLAKYNKLQQEYKTMECEHAYNKQSCVELLKDKQLQELEIVRTKAEYDEDLRNCREDFGMQLSSLHKMEGNLKSEINELTDALTSANDDISQLNVELIDAKENLIATQKERDELLKKIEDLEISNQQLEKNYAALGIQNESLLKESKAELVAMQDRLHVVIKEHEVTIEQKRKEIEKLTREIAKCQDSLKSHKAAHGLDCEQFQQQIQSMNASITSFTQNIAKLTKERDILQARIDHHKNIYSSLVEKTNQKDEKIALLETQLKKLQVSHDVLEAGKGKMEKMKVELEGKLHMLQQTQQTGNDEYVAQIKRLQTHIDKLTVQLDQHKEIIREKNEEIVSLNGEFDSVQLILTNMTKQMETSTRELTTIHEDYEGKLNSERKALVALQSQYETTTKELQYVSQLNRDLNEELREVKNEISTAEVIINSKEEMLAEMTQKYDQVAAQVVAKDATLASLQTELAARLEQLAHDSAERQLLEDKHRRAEEEVQEVMRHREELIEKHAENVRAGEESLLRVQGKIKGLLEQLAERDEHVRALNTEREAQRLLEMRVLELESQVYEANIVKRKLQANVRRFAALLNEKDDVLDDVDLDDLIQQIETRIIGTFGKLRELATVHNETQKDKENSERSLTELQKCHKELIEEQTKLLQEYERLHEEKVAILQEKAKDSKSLENLKTQFEVLKDKQHFSAQLQEKVDFLERNHKSTFNSYKEFLCSTQSVFKSIEEMITKRNSIEQIVYNLKDLHTTMQIKSSHITEESHRLHYEQKSALEVIIDDIQKQFRRFSKMIYNQNLKCHQIVERTVNALLCDSKIEWTTVYKDMDGDEIESKLDDLKDNAENALEQLKTFVHAIDQLVFKEEKPKVLKENVVPVNKPKEDDWKRKYLSIKQKLALVENAKNNFEKKIRQLREENKILADGKVQSSVAPAKVDEGDAAYKKLLNDYIELKDAYQKAQSAQDNTPQAPEQGQGDFSDDELRRELTLLKDSYSQLKIVHSKLELDYKSLNRILEERNEQLCTNLAAKESYGTLCEENTRLKSEIDTLTYKRQRDREEYVRLIGKNDSDMNKKVQAVKTDYDSKLEKMKNMIVSKYKEQIEQNDADTRERLASLESENKHYKSTVVRLKEELGRISAKVEVLNTEKQYAMQQLKLQRNESLFKEPLMLSRRASTQSLQNDAMRGAAYIEERRFSTMPRNASAMDVIEEVRIRRRTSVTATPTASDDFHMEDEGDMFNNKYLHDLKAGRFDDAASSSDRESISSRLSEMVVRNSMCPPHLKSSYPAETQFFNRNFVKDEDIKSGNLEFDDNMKTHLLPQEKSKKKDIGTTSYKKPGPPTPSKNGGRSSLQGNNNQREVLRELTDQKRITPNPLRALFSRSKDSSSSERTSVSPRKRTSFFRR